VLAGLRWQPVVRGSALSIPEATRVFPTFADLAAAARGMVFLDLVPDRDGVYRRLPLLVRSGDGFLPSLALRVAADYLGVAPSTIVVEPGRSITLPGARRPRAGEAQDVTIPIDRRGSMVVNFRGPWGSLTSYPAFEIVEAAGDRFAMEDLRAEIAGRIGLVAWIATGAGDVGPVPTDPLYPLPGIHANALNTILSGSFLRELSGPATLLWIEIPLLLLLLVAALRFSTIPFLSIALGLVLGYAAVVAVAFLLAGRILDLPGPALFLVGSTIVVAAFQYHVESRARARLDRELAVARAIQMSTLPQTMPAVAGYDLAGLSRPADETGGDTFDLVPAGPERAVLLLGDATGHGLGPALSVTQVRAMLRVALRLGADIDGAFTHINDQLAQDLASNKFVTVFLGLLDGAAHRVHYHSGGQGPLLHFHAATSTCEWRDSTTMPLGFMEGIPLKPPKAFELAPGDILGLATDGLFEYESRGGEQFGQERVEALIARHQHEPMERLAHLLLDAVREHGTGIPQPDDITIVLVRRLP
jgi:serine phosphatase RsbU (regulator of sigma subunit)